MTEMINVFISHWARLRLLSKKMICLDCAAVMQEAGPDAWNCSGCGFQAVQMSLWGFGEMVEFNRTKPDYTKVNTYSMSPGERAALEARQRDTPNLKLSGYALATTAPQQGMYGGKHYRKKGGDK